MSDWIPDVVTSATTILGAGVVTALVQGWNKRQERKAEAEAKALEASEERKTKAQTAYQEDRKDAVGILREALTEERKDHASCQERVTQVEAAMFREREERAREQAQCEGDVARLQTLVMELYTKSTPPAERDPAFMARLSRSPRRLGAGLTSSEPGL